MFDLKPLSPEGVQAALEKARRYRLLNEPWEADSICRDILAVEPENQDAIMELILAVTQALADETGGGLTEAVSLVNQLTDEYAQSYYAGIIYERRAKELLAHGTLGGGPAAYTLLRDAMAAYEAAERVRPSGDDSAILRWNACARIIMRNKLKSGPGPPGQRRSVPGLPRPE